MSTVLGLFADRNNADRAVATLQNHGYTAKDISIAMRQTEISEENSTGARVTEGVVSGATTGGAVGALAGLLVGVGAVIIPGLGAILIGGPLAAALGLTGAAATAVSAAATGAAAGGVIGGLTGLGLPEETARIYETRLREGAILVAVTVAAGNEDEVRDFLSSNGAEQTRQLPS